MTVAFLAIQRGIFGNTALHLAAKEGVEPQLVQYLLSVSGVKVNGMNDEGKTALDIATGVDSTNNPNLCQIARILEDENAVHGIIKHSKPSRQLEQRANQRNDNEDKVLSVDTLVASLVATVTFAAMFQVPGGTTKGGDDEMALQALFQVFLFSNCLAFFGSIIVIIAWIFRERLHERLAMDQSPLAKLSLISIEISVMSTALAFLCATILVTIPHHLTGKKKVSMC
ncbi:hypothetical protein SUGI_0549640 [Cryptomeria japonica]|uniref:ankyrin repeat-containing protein ITN1-like isoform X1 n=1 Tax=Cryptomeria japonica TaxID=3369 RepID=UPI002408DFFA|nr:ankyrin repeat-containing protein ITN1-like isoform X1 [Cryptomeria japonica]GLJ27992.1 hypothetical protein SUGI_0549640 [Cryptomeria japonica]